MTNVKNQIPDSNAFLKKKTDYATEISGIKNSYVTNSTDILDVDSRLKQKEDILNDLETEASFHRGNCYYNQQSYDRYGGVSNSWISTVIHNDSNNTDLFSVKNLPHPPTSSNITGFLPTLLNQNNRLGVTFRGNYMKQNKLGYYHGSVINIYIVYKLNDLRNS